MNKIIDDRHDRVQLMSLKHLCRKVKSHRRKALLALPLIFGTSPAYSYVKFSGDIWYEYTDSFTSPFRQVLSFVQTTGKQPLSFAPDRSAHDVAYIAAIAAQKNAWLAKMAAIGYELCSEGTMQTVDSDSYITKTYGAQASSVGLIGVTFKSYTGQSCDSPNLLKFQPSLVERNISWNNYCPVGFFEAPDGGQNLVCRRPLDYCPKSCGNPVTHTGVKIQPELDYRSADGLLEYRRTYSSVNFPTPGWIHSYQNELRFNGEIARVRRENGSRLYFKFDGSNFLPIQPTTARLRFESGLFVLTTEDDRAETYDGQGSLVRITYRDGKTLNITRTYPEKGYEIVQVTDTYGRQLEIHYKPAEWGGDGVTLQEVRLPDGAMIKYGYSSETGALTSVEYPDHKVRRYGYGGESNEYNLVSITDENNVSYANFGYEAIGSTLVVTTMHAGATDRYEVRDETGRFITGYGNITEKNPGGGLTTYRYEKVAGISRQVSTVFLGVTAPLTYDVNGNLASSTDFNGNLTLYTHDLGRNLEISRTEGLTASGAATSVTRTIETTWHPKFKLPVRVVEKDVTGAALRQTDTSYDDKGNKTSQSVKDVAANTSRTTTWTYTYSATVPGHVEKLVIDGPRTDVQDITFVDYWPADAACSGTETGQDKGCRGQIKAITNALGNTIHYAAYDADSRPLSVVDANGVPAKLGYNPRGWLTSQSVGDETTSFAYDDVGQLRKVTFPDNAYIAYEHDAAHRLIKVSDSLANSVAYTLDNAGNRTAEEIKDADGLLVRKVMRVFDSFNRLQQVTGAVQ